jgi:MYXO-CTERM domain-containing protein
MHILDPRALAAVSALSLTVGCLADGTTTAPVAVGYDQAAVAALPAVDRVLFADDGVPYFMRGELARVDRLIASVDDADRYMADALDRIAAPLRLSSADFAATRVTTDVVGMTHVRFQQVLEDLPVIGGELILHLGHGGEVESITNAARAPGNVAATPKLSAADAAELARLATLDGQADVLAHRLVYFLDNAGQTRLAWEVDVAGREALVMDRVYVAATDGEVLARHPQVFTARDREVKDGNGQESIIAIIFARTVGTETSPPSADPTAMAAYRNTGLMYDCYSDLYGRDSYDDLGAKLTSIVHVTFQGTGNNAAWAGNVMLYGDGDGQFFKQLAEAYDVTAHELTHGVVTATANLTYQNESGALNEGWADIMASVCEAWNDGGVTDDTWLIGEDIFTPGTPGDALRYMNDPTADSGLYPPELGGSRDFYADRYRGSEDNGGVHLNSGIANLAFQLLVAGGSHPRGKTDINVVSMDIAQAGEIFLNALENQMTSETTFAQARTATEEAARSLYGETEAAKVGLAWAAVGIGTPPVFDRTPPTVAITSPANGATVEAGFEVVVTANDDKGVARVAVLIDGTNLGSRTAAPYSFTAPADLSAGPHTVQASASDGFNEASAQITVNIPAAGCRSDDECPGDETCQDGVCLPPDGGTCTSDDDCPGNQTCQAGVCENPEVPTPVDGGGDGEGGCGCRASNDASGALSALFALFGVVLVTRRRWR